MMIPVASEIEGVRRAIGLARPKDVIYVLSDDPAALWSELDRLGPLVQLKSTDSVLLADRAPDSTLCRHRSGRTNLLDPH